MTDTADSVARSWDESRAWFDALSDHVEDWQGVPVLMNDPYAVLHDRHPLAGFYRQHAEEQHPTEPDRDDDLMIVNHWFSRQRNADVYVCRDGGRPVALTVPRSPDQSMDRLTLWLSTLGASDAWDLAAESTARFKLAGLLTERQWRHYDLTGSFLETSKRSGLTYLFRRLRPTIALSSRNKRGDEMMRCIAVLCLHPVGLYGNSWGGCMVPSDDVIAHLLMMRGDEAYFWRKANLHEPWRPEAGL